MSIILHAFGVELALLRAPNEQVLAIRGVAIADLAGISKPKFRTNADMAAEDALTYGLPGAKTVFLQEGV